MLLVFLLLIPLMTSMFALILHKCAKAVDLVKAVILLALGSTIVITFYLYVNFDFSTDSFQYMKQFLPWTKALSTGSVIAPKIGVDGTSLLFLMLSAILTAFSCIWIKNWNENLIKLALLLLLEFFSFGVFVSLDILVLYVFFELTLVPMFFIIGMWGGDKRQYASLKFFLYTALGSIFMLVSVLYIYFQSGTTDILELGIHIKQMSYTTRTLLWWALFIGFAVKIPMVPLHSWLPDAHVQAPTYGSVILAGILIKIGAYGMLRVLLPLFPELSLHYAPMVYILSVIAIIYTSFVSMAQSEMKKVIAYSSIAHMGMVTMGIFSFNDLGRIGAVFQMISHGLVSSALFLCIGWIYENSGSKMTKNFGGLATKMPKHAVVFLIFTMASVGLPGTSGFIGEYLVMQGVMKNSIIYGILAASGVVLGACYMLPLYRKIEKGPLLTNNFTAQLTDCGKSEIFVLATLALMIIALGFYPEFILKGLR